MYFAKFPYILYDSVGNLDFKVVTNLLRRVALRANLREDTLVFDTYTVKDGESPEILEEDLQDKRRLIRLLDPSYLSQFTEEFEELMEESAI